MLRRVTLTERAHKSAAEHLLSHYSESGFGGHEDLCFAVWRPSTGEQTQTALVDEIIRPQHGDRNLHGNASFEPQFLQRALNRAHNQKAGLAFMHSHPCDGWQGMSHDDVVAERDVIAPRAKPLGLPLVGMTVGTDGAWSARFWERGTGGMKKRDCERVNVVGGCLHTTFHPRMVPPFERREEFKRTTSAWGEDAQCRLGRLRIGIVGLGSVGYFVAESLARMGVQHLTLIDPDKVERHNIDRLLHASSEDIGRLKVALLAERLKKSATARREEFIVRAMPCGVHDRSGFKAALDCDVLFCCVDKPRGRHRLNYIAYSHLIPVFEGGIIAAPQNGKMGRPRWQTHAAYPGVRCLRCHGQYDEDGLSAEVSGEQDSPSYTGQREKEVPNENVFVFSAHLASTQVLQMLRHVVAHGCAVKPHTHFSYRPNKFTATSPKPCEQGCKFPGLTAKGDRATDHLIGREPAADARPFGLWRRILDKIFGREN